MTREQIEEIEKLTTFQSVFMYQYWFKSYDEYLKLFGDDIEAREKAVKDFKRAFPKVVKLYPNLFNNIKD